MQETNIADIPDIENICQAQDRIRPWVRETPVMNDQHMDEVLDCSLYAKCENLQRTGSFKFRGASNAICSLHENSRHGAVATHSSGNHGAALALAASLDGRKAHIVMPRNSVPMKIESVRRYGGQIHFCEATQDSREEALEKLIAEGKIPVHPYDNASIIAGQGTAAMELLQQVPGLDLIITPLGGGGLVSGTAIAASAQGIPVYGVEPAGAADTVASLQQGARVESWQADTIADGLRALVGVRNFAVIQARVSKVLTTSDAEICRAMSLFWRETRMTIEPSSATVIAAIRNHPEIFGGKRVGAIITGGNLDPASWVAMTERDSG